MKKVGKKQSSNGSDIFEFLIGVEELRNLEEILRHFTQNIPISVDTIQIRGRIKNMRNEIISALKEHNPIWDKFRGKIRIKVVP